MTDSRTTRPGRPPAPRPTTPNLLSSWRRMHGDLEESALADLNAALGTRYTISRLGEWERGQRTPAPDVVNYMLADALPGILRESGLAPDVARDVWLTFCYRATRSIRQ